MKRFIPLVVFACALPVARADTPATLSVAKGGHLWIEGDSTLHKYKLTAAQFSLDFTLQNGVGDARTIVTSNGVKTLTLRVPVAQLTSGEKGLDDNMRKALAADQHPDIVFQMSAYKTEPGENGTFLAHLTGVLTIAGKQRTVMLEAKGMPVASGIHFSGTKRVLMSDYGVKPPVLMLGTLKTADAIDVKLDVMVSESSPTSHESPTP